MPTRFSAPKSSTFIAAAAIAVLAGVSPPPVVHGDDALSVQGASELEKQSATSALTLRRHVEYLASAELEGRGTARGKQLARDYIQKQIEELRLEPLFGKSGFFQEIPGPRDKQGEPTVLGKNIAAWLPGSDPDVRDEFVILSAHYDHLGVADGHLFPGADDNAGSVAMLLEVARQYVHSGKRPRRSLIFLSCDLEEKLLWGSRWFVAHPPRPLKQIKLFVTAEMIGRTLGDLPMKTIFVLGGEHAEGLKKIVNSVDVPAEIEVAHLGIDLIGTRSDYGPFWSEKVPFLFFSGGEHPDYHTPRDTADRIDYERAACVSNLIAGVCRRVADAETPPAWTDAPTHELDEVRTLHRITELVLKTDDAAEKAGKPRLTQLQRFTVTNVHSRTAQIIERGEFKPEDRPWLIRSAQVLLLTVF
jgi:Zn-dependent M28 family amino/carboxypeptidase